MTKEAILAELDHLADTLAVSPDKAAVELGRLRGGLRASLEVERRRLIQHIERQGRRGGSALAPGYRDLIARIQAKGDRINAAPEPRSAH